MAPSHMPARARRRFFFGGLFFGVTVVSWSPVVGLSTSAVSAAAARSTAAGSTTAVASASASCWSATSAAGPTTTVASARSEEHTSELQSRGHLVCRLLLDKKNVHTISRQPQLPDDVVQLQ